MLVDAMDAMRKAQTRLNELRGFAEWMRDATAKPPADG